MLLKELEFSEVVQAIENAIMDSHLMEVCLGYYTILVRIRGRTLFILNCYAEFLQ